MRLTSSSRSPASVLAWSGSGMRLLSPLPSACLFISPDHLPGQVQVRLRALGTDVVKHDRLPEAGRFTESHIARHDRPIHPVLEEGFDVGDYLAGQVGPFVEHGQENTIQLERRL